MPSLLVVLVGVIWIALGSAVAIGRRRLAASFRSGGATSAWTSPTGLLWYGIVSIGVGGVVILVAVTH